MRSLLVVGSLCLVGLVYCGPAQNCVPGKTESCACPEGAVGAQACKVDGSGWETCVCPGSDGGVGDGGVNDGASGEGGNREPLSEPSAEVKSDATAGERAPEAGSETFDDRVAECQSRAACWDLRCPQDDPSARKSCIDGRLQKSQYVSCIEGTCKDIPKGEQGAVQIKLSWVDDKDDVKWLAGYVFASKDMEEKEVTCSRLKQLLDVDPANLLDKALGGYHPPRNYTAGVYQDVVRTSSGFHDVSVTAAMPQGKGYVILVRGFCNPDVGRPDDTTKHKWIVCKEGVEIKASPTPVELMVPSSGTPPCSR